MPYNVDPYLGIHRQRLAEAERRRIGVEAARSAKAGHRGLFARLRGGHAVIAEPSSRRGEAWTRTNA